MVSSSYALSVEVAYAKVRGESTAIARDHMMRDFIESRAGVINTNGYFPVYTENYLAVKRKVSKNTCEIHIK